MTTRPVVRYAIPDLELGTVVEESFAVEAGDADDDTDNLPRHGRRKKNRCKGFSHYKPSNHRKRRTKNMKKRNGLEREDSIRKEEVSKENKFRFLLSI